jgi:hypothetical protein
MISSLITEALAWLVGHIGHDRLAGRVLERDPQRHLVPAERVHMVHLGVVRLPQPLVVRVPVVVQDDFLIERLQAHQAPPKKR